MGDIRIRAFSLTQIRHWFISGWRLATRRPAETLRPAAVFALFALLLIQIPVVGTIPLLLLVPTFLASYLMHAHRIGAAGPNPPPPDPTLTQQQRWLKEIQQAFFSAWSKPANIFSLVAIGLVLVVVGLVAIGLFKVVGGQTVLKATPFAELSIAQMVQFTLAHAIVTILWSAACALLLWVPPLLVIRDLELGEALQWSMRGLKENIGPAIALPLLFALCLWPGLLLRPWLSFLHYVVEWALLTGATAFFCFSAYCSYRLVFADPAAPPARSAAPHPAMAQRPAAMPPRPRTP